MRRLALALLTIFVFACGGSAPAPAPETAPAPVQPAPAAPAGDAAIGSGRVTASTLNVRSEASTTAAIVVQVKRGQTLALLAVQGDWSRVRLESGDTGWVASQHVSRDGAQAAPRGRKGCPADADFRFTHAPTPTFSDSS